MNISTARYKVIPFLPSANEVGEGNVFICVCPSVSQSVHGGVPCDHYPWCIGTHYTGPLSAALAHPGHGTSGPSPHPPLLVTSGGHQWRCVQICSLQDPLHQCWHLEAIEAGTVSASGWYTSYWNSFFCFIVLLSLKFQGCHHSCGL